MGKKKKTVLKSFDYLHCDDFAAYLEAMAAKGWHFTEWGAGLIFEKGEPKKDVYCVEVFSEASEYDTRPEVNTQEFAEYCEAAGWHLVDAKRKFCIFKKVRLDAVDILTPEERLHNIAKEEKKEIWQKVGLCGWMAALQVLQFSLDSSFINRIFFNYGLLIDAMWIVLGLTALGRCIHFYLWKYNSEKKIARGEAVAYRKGKSLFSFLSGWYGWITGSVVLLYDIAILLTGQYIVLVYTAAILVPIILMAYLIAKFRPDAVTNQIIQTVVPMLIFVVVMTVSVGVMFTKEDDPVLVEDIPLVYADIGGEAGILEDVYLDGSGSIFGSALRCRLSYEEESINYSVYRSEQQWILNRIWNDEAEKAYNQNGIDCTDQWEVEEAYRNGRGDYMVRYPDAILILGIAEDTVLTKFQTDIVRSALYESR